MIDADLAGQRGTRNGLLRPRRRRLDNNRDGFQTRGGRAPFAGLKLTVAKTPIYLHCPVWNPDVAMNDVLGGGFKPAR
jgi:hypothetical protein